MAEKREKTISYRRATWVHSSGLTLEKCIREAYEKLQNVAERTVSRGDQEIKTAKFIEFKSRNGLLLHITSDTPGEYASAVPTVAQSIQEIDLTVAKPPPNSEWLDGDAFVLVIGDHVCLCTTGIRDGAVRTYFYELFKKAKLRKDSTQFDLLKVANIKKIKMIYAQGVKEIQIKAAIYKAASQYEKRKNRTIGVIGAVGKFFASLRNKPNDVTPDGLTANLIITKDRRFTKGMAISEKRIENLAADIVNHSVENYEDYTIVTRAGNKISPNEIFVKSAVLIDKEGKTVQREKAWKELVRFYSDLSDSGVLEQ